MFDHQKHPSNFEFAVSRSDLVQEVEDPEPNWCGLGTLDFFDKTRPSVVLWEWSLSKYLATLSTSPRSPRSPMCPHDHQKSDTFNHAWHIGKNACLQHKARLVHQEGPESAGDALYGGVCHLDYRPYYPRVDQTIPCQVEAVRVEALKCWQHLNATLWFLLNCRIDSRGINSNKS